MSSPVRDSRADATAWASGHASECHTETGRYAAIAVDNNCALNVRSGIGREIAVAGHWVKDVGFERRQLMIWGAKGAGIA